MDARAQQARSHQRAIQEGRALVAQHVTLRNNLVRLLHSTGDWSYSQLAAAVGCSPELIAKIVQERA